VPYSIKIIIKNKTPGEAFEIRNFELSPRHLSKHSKNSDLFRLVPYFRTSTIKTGPHPERPGYKLRLRETEEDHDAV